MLRVSHLLFTLNYKQPKEIGLFVPILYMKIDSQKIACLVVPITIAAYKAIPDFVAESICFIRFLSCVGQEFR